MKQYTDIWYWSAVTAMIICSAIMLYIAPVKPEKLNQSKAFYGHTGDKHYNPCIVVPKGYWDQTTRRRINEK